MRSAQLSRAKQCAMVLLLAMALTGVFLILLCGALFGASFGSLPNYGSSPLSGWTGIGGVEGGESFWG